LTFWTRQGEGHGLIISAVHHLSLPRPFTPDLERISFTNPFLHSLPASFRTAFTDLEPVPY